MYDTFLPSGESRKFDTDGRAPKAAAGSNCFALSADALVAAITEIAKNTSLCMITFPGLDSNEPRAWPRFAATRGHNARS
jgi:hypothetical protein